MRKGPNHILLNQVEEMESSLSSGNLGQESSNKAKHGKAAVQCLSLESEACATALILGGRNGHCAGWKRRDGSGSRLKLSAEESDVVVAHGRRGGEGQLAAR